MKTTIDEINDLWETDSHIDHNKINEESLKTAKLHQKYLVLLMDSKKRLLRMENDYILLKSNKTRYYRGEMTKEELKLLNWEQFQGLKPLKSDLASYVELDTDIIACKNKIKFITDTIYQLESILQQIKSRDWSIRNHIEYLKFISGN